MQRPFLVTKRGKVWYYRLAGEVTFHSTGQRGSRGAAESWVLVNVVGDRRPSDAAMKPFAEYAERFFRRETDPHVLRKAEEGRRIGTGYLIQGRRMLEQHILTDPIAKMPLGKISRGDLLEFRRRLSAKNPGKSNTVNKAVGTLKSILKEAVFLQDLLADPGVGIGSLHYERIRPGALTAEELRMLFPSSGRGPWKDNRDHACFLLAATTGMRHGEIMALRWRELDLEARCVRIERAVKRFESADGLPKSGHPRVAPLPEVTVGALLAYRETVIRHHPNDLVFCYDDGVRLGHDWWLERFHRAVAGAGIQPAGRHLVPHSLRHSLATLLAAEEYDREKLRAALGWADEAIRQNYTHLGAEHLRGQAEIVDRLLAGK